jgi:hypothetical protein
MGAISQRGLDLGAGVQRAEHRDGAYGRSGEVGCDIMGDAGEAEDTDMQ